MGQMIEDVKVGVNGRIPWSSSTARRYRPHPLEVAEKAREILAKI
jgi:hypothetical protein